MANRKQELDAAVAQSKQEVAERMAPQPAAQPSPGFELPYTKQLKTEAAAPVHPRAAKGRQVRQRELDAGMAAGRQQEAQRTEAGQAKVSEGQGLVGHTSKRVPGFKDSNKKVGVRQVKGYSGNKRRSKLINSGRVVLDKDYSTPAMETRYTPVTAQQSQAKLNTMDIEAEKQKAEAKFLKRPKKKAVKQKSVTKKPIKGVMGSRITPGKKGGK